MNFSKNIGQNSSLFTLIIVAVAIVMGTLSGEAQMLNSRKQGTVAEQLEQNSRQREGLVQEILNYAYKYRGMPYRHGAMSPRAFDCSGFTSYVFKRFGFSLDRTSRGQIYDGRRVNRDELQPGDLVFFNGRAVNHRIGHVGIVTEVDKQDGTFKFIHAARTGVQENKSTETYYRRRYMGACRVVE